MGTGIVHKDATLCSLQPNIQCTSSAHTTAAITSSVHTLQQPLHLQCTHCSSHYIFSAHTTAAITSSVHTLQQPLHLQCTHYSSHYIFSAHCSHVQPCTAMYSYLQPIFSAHCSHVYPCTAICSQSSVHPAANRSHLQPPTLQLYHPVHTTAIPSSVHCSYIIQCTLQLHYLMPIPYSAPSEEG